MRSGIKTRGISLSYLRRIRDYKDELRLIEKAELKDMEVLGDILARYIQKGMVKGAVWNEGVEYGVYEKVITKMKEYSGSKYWQSWKNVQKSYGHFSKWKKQKVSQM